MQENGSQGVCIFVGSHFFLLKDVYDKFDPLEGARVLSHISLLTDSLDPTLICFYPSHFLMFFVLFQRVEKCCSAIMASLFILFNAMYWPWLLRDEDFDYAKFNALQ